MGAAGCLAGSAAMATEAGQASGKAGSDRTVARKWPWALGGLAVLIAGAAGFFFLSRSPEPSAQPAAPPPLVEVARAEAIETLVLRQTAFVRPVAELAVRSETTARIAEVTAAFDRGRRVGQGTVLLRLDPSDIEGSVARAEAALSQAEATVTETRIEADRQETLESRGVVAEAVLQDARVALATAEAGLERAEVELRLAQDALRDTEIVAPFDALVVETSADLGELVGPDTVLGRLVSAEAVELEVGLLPRDLALLPGGVEALRGARVALRDGAAGPVIAEGSVTSVARGLAETTRLLPLVVRVTDPFDGARPLRLGELLLAELPTRISGGGALAVPDRALKPGGVIWVVRDGALVRLEPELLLRQDGPEVTRAILRSGALTDGDDVMLTDLPAAAEGQAVRTGEDAAGGT